MRYYELTCIISSDFSEEKLISYLRTEPISKHSASGLISLEFYAEPDKIEEIEKKLKDDPTIQKYLILNKQPTKLGIKPLKRARPEVKIQLEKPKVALKEIEKKLDEILNQ